VEERLFAQSPKDVPRMADKLAVRNGKANPISKDWEQAGKK
jgi:hypothetical protein